MADDASCRFILDDNQLLTHFNERYPQNMRWQLLTTFQADLRLAAEMAAKAISRGRAKAQNATWTASWLPSWQPSESRTLTSMTYVTNTHPPCLHSVGQGWKMQPQQK